MHHAGTVCQGDIVGAGHKKGFLALCIRIGKQRLILFIFQVFSGIAFQNLVIALQDRVAQGLGQVVYLALVFHLYIFLLRVDAERHVGRKGPGGGGPGQNPGILSPGLKFGHQGFFLYILIALGYLMAGQRSAAAGAVGHHLISFVQQALLPDFF